MSHSIKPIPAVEEYFGRGTIPMIAQTFTPGKGWSRSYPMHKRVSRAWLTKLKEEGITTVALRANGRTADFSVAELLKVDRRPLLTGNLIGAAVRLDG